MGGMETLASSHRSTRHFPIGSIGKNLIASLHLGGSWRGLYNMAMGMFGVTNAAECILLI
jgi:hypothetical protein